MDFGRLEHAADADRAVTRELLQPILECGLAAAAKARFVVAHAFDHIGEELGAAFGAEYRGRALEQQRRGSERLDLEAHRAQLAERAVHLRRARGIQLNRDRREHRLGADTAVAELAPQLLERDALVRRVLIDQEQALLGFERDIASEDLSDDAELRVYRDRSRRRCTARAVAIEGEGKRALKR